MHYRIAELLWIRRLLLLALASSKAPTLAHLLDLEARVRARVRLPAGEDAPEGFATMSADVVRLLAKLRARRVGVRDRSKATQGDSR